MASAMPLPARVNARRSARYAGPGLEAAGGKENVGGDGDVILARMRAAIQSSAASGPSATTTRSPSGPSGRRIQGSTRNG